MRPRDHALAHQLEAALNKFHKTKRPLPGIATEKNRRAFAEQLLESIHRVRFVSVLRTRGISVARTDPNNVLFDPLRAAILNMRQDNIEEAFWLVFIFVHFGKHLHAGWRYAREVYGRLGGPGRWDWANTSADTAGFRAWLEAHKVELRREGIPRGFGNHRKYESLDGYSANGTGAVVESYVAWVDPPRNHRELIDQAYNGANGDPGMAFDSLYESMGAIARFGRTARFDYLTMLGKLGLAPIAPNSAYLKGATGPVKGAGLLFGMNESPATLDQWLGELDTELVVGMQVLEDALCNWQKSPSLFKPFRG
jgi:hypothetical protein